jgi:hypothetical protein
VEVVESEQEFSAHDGDVCFGYWAWCQLLLLAISLISPFTVLIPYLRQNLHRGTP